MPKVKGEGEIAKGRKIELVKWKREFNLTKS